jgi:hypothetical protein
MTITEVQQLEYEKDAIHYTIHVESDGDMMWGTWECRECAMGGTGSKKFTTIGQAAVAAQGEIDRHHDSYHGLR